MSPIAESDKALRMIVSPMIMGEEQKNRYRVRKKNTEAPHVCTLELSREGAALPDYIPGQCITVYFPDLGVPEGKAYSISSAPHEDSLNITVRAMGKFSNRLCSLMPGDTVITSPPYGYFYNESKSPLIMLAGGTGVMPFRSMIINELRKNPSRKLRLLYSSRTRSDIIFHDLFENLHSSHRNFEARYFVTRERDLPQPIIQRRMLGSDVLQRIEASSNPEFMICGSIPFVRDLWRSLRAGGVPEERLYTEAFFSH